MAQTKIEGTVTDKDNGEPLINAPVKVFKGKDLYTGAVTDFDGNYSIIVDPGNYNVEVSFYGNSQRFENVRVTGGKVTKLNFSISSGIQLEAIEIKEYKKPIVEIDKTSSDQTITAEDIKTLGTRNINAIASTVSGISSVDGGDISIRGARTDGTVYFLDGVRITGRAPSAVDIEQVTVIKGGLEPQYGDATGGIISLVTKGPSSKFGGSLEAETSNYLDPYGYTFISGNVSGPIIRHNNRTLVGFRLSGQYTELKDDDPPAFGDYFAKESTIARLTANPVIPLNGIPVVNGLFLKEGEDVEFSKFNKNDQNIAYDVSGKIDVKPNQNIDLTISGTYSNVEDRFVPGTNETIGGGSWRLLNWVNNPVQDRRVLRGNLRFRHRLGKLVDLSPEALANQDQNPKKLSVIQNPYYTIQLGYENRNGGDRDIRHTDNLFNHGHVAQFTREWLRVRNEDLLHVGYIDQVVGYENGTVNPAFNNYNLIPQADLGNIQAYRAFNSNISSAFSDVWSGIHTNVGSVYNRFNKFDNNIYTAQITSGFDFIPGGSKKGRHNIQFGILFEQSINSNYSIEPFDLWRLGRLYQNDHITGVDSNNIIGYDTIIDAQGNPLYLPYFQTLITDPDERRFYRSIRSLQYPGMDSTESAHLYADIDRFKPSDLSLDMFTMRELTDQSIMGFYGYDYLGNKTSPGVKFDDFFKVDTINGVAQRRYQVAPFSPIYVAGYLQDKFTYKDIIFRVGGRVDYYDANTKVLSDPYSLYGIQGAGTFHQNVGTAKPSTIGDDYKVYLVGAGSTQVKAYRNGDQWFFANGTAANNSLAIFGDNNLVAPAYIQPEDTLRSIRGKFFNPDQSFEDYKPQINWMPRIAFSFPISDAANFFAHYDIVVQRPTGENIVSPLQFLYWDINGRTPSANSNLRPSRKVDYEVGFQQKITNSSSIIFSAYYNELRDMIQITTLTKVATIGQYNTFRNLDFGTVKGFNFTYDLRRVNNFQFNAAYTLQFADGTGSDARSQEGLTGRGINIRNIFPFNYDERHRFSFNADYRYGSGKLYNGPRIGGLDLLANTGLNILMIAASGRPYSQGLSIVRFDGAGFKGNINGARLPWNFNIDLRADKYIALTKPGAKHPLNLNVYLRIQNLLDTRNIIGVYRGSGSASDDGYLTSERGANERRNVTNTYGSQYLPFFENSYNWALLNPDFYTLPRRIYVGAIFEF
ncbi:MAG: TonB-dependent receptor [Saprospiraceae bacterium]|nr:TonB-dependent receptor [Saprospiraceae bacterium]